MKYLYLILSQLFIGIIIIIIFIVVARDPEKYGITFLSKVDRTNYEDVAEKFIRSNVTIVKELGAINDTIKILGGPPVGDKCYVEYRANGEKKMGKCGIYLMRDSEKQWFVTDANMTYDGKTVTLPVKSFIWKRW
jgi:hypothetical protein